MLKIRLQRIGKKKQSHFKIVVQEARSKVGGKYLEYLGFWNPHQDIFKVNEERIKYWLDHGAQMTKTVYNFWIKKRSRG